MDLTYSLSEIEQNVRMWRNGYCSERHRLNESAVEDPVGGAASAMVRGSAVEVVVVLMKASSVLVLLEVVVEEVPSPLREFSKAEGDGVTAVARRYTALPTCSVGIRCSHERNMWQYPVGDKTNTVHLGYCVLHVASHAAKS